MGKLKVTNIGKNIPLFLKRLKKLKPVFVRTIEEDVRNFNSYELVYICLTNLNWLTNNKVFDYSKKELSEIIKALPKKNTKQFNELVTKISDILDEDFDNEKVIQIQKDIDAKISNQQLNDENFITDENKVSLSEDEINIIVDTVGLQTANYSTIQPDTLSNIVADAIFEVTGNNVTDISTEDYTEIYTQCENLYLTEMNVQESYMEEYM